MIRKSWFPVAGLLLLAACAKKPELMPAPQISFLVADVRAEPSQAAVTLLGKSVGSTPQRLGLSNLEDLLNIDASRENDPLIEKRIRYLSADKAEVIFVFASGRSAMAKLLGLPKILVFEYGASLSFDMNKFDLKAEFLPFLDRQAAMLNKYFSELDVYVFGHTDNTGANDHNFKLSLDRAQAVADALAGKDVEKARLKVQGLGSQYPVASHETPEDRARNQRTEIILGQ